MISCLRRAGVEVVERHVPVWEGREHKFRARAGAALRLTLAELRLRIGSTDADAVVVGYPGHLDVGAARRLGKPVVLNPLVSLADTLVADRGRFRRGGVADRLLRRIDQRAFSRADLVVADTAAQAELFGALGARRVEVAFVGAEERIFQPGWEAPKEFTALFVGKLIPLHGLETILETAREYASHLRFRIVGSGQLDHLLRDAPANIEHVPWVDYERLPEELHRASCALGIFGTSAKAQRVIPNKVFQALACGTPVVTGDTPAARELLRDGESALLTKPGDPETLAGALGKLDHYRHYAQNLGAAGLTAYRAHASEHVLGARWRGLIESLL